MFKTEIKFFFTLIDGFSSVMLTCIGWQMRLREGVSPGLVLSGRRLSSSPSNKPRSRSLLVLSELGSQLKNEWELGEGKTSLRSWANTTSYMLRRVDTIGTGDRVLVAS